MTGDDFLEVLQADVVAILKAVPTLEAVNIIPEDDGDMEARITRMLGTLEGGATGKAGCVAVVMLPEITEAESNQPGPPVTVEIKVQIIEQHIINRGADGSGVRSSVGALRVLNALHLQTIGHACVYAGKKPLEPVEVKKGYLSHMVTLTVHYRGLEGPGKPLGVSATMAGDPEELTLACGTSGASIHYTTDGTYPSPETASYSVPIAGLDAGTIVRAAAYKSGLNPGNVTEILITE